MSSGKKTDVDEQVSAHLLSDAADGDATHTETKQESKEYDKLLLTERVVNGKNGTNAAEIVMDSPPVDRYFIVYIIFIIHGIGTLMPWNMFITANDYFVKYKLASSGNSTGAVEYGNYFLSYLGFVAQVPSVIINGFNLFANIKGGNTSCRIVWSIIVVVLMFIITIILAMLDSSTWAVEFFWVTMVTVVIINMANGIYQNSLYGTAACLPMKYTGSIILGSNISGTFTSVVAIIALASTPNPRSAAIYYFLTAIFILLVVFDTFYGLQLIPFYKHFKQRSEGSQTEEERPRITMSTYLHVFKKCWIHDLSVFFVFFVTLTCFPPVMAGIESTDPNFPIPKMFFSAVTCFLFFNVFAMMGNIVSYFTQLQIKAAVRSVNIRAIRRGLSRR